MQYVIHAMETENKGACGIEDWAFAKCETEEQAIQYAYSLCSGLISKYSTINRKIKKTVSARVKRERAPIDEIEREVIRENSYFEIYKVDMEKVNSWQEMASSFRTNKQKFLQDFCIRCV